MLLFASEENTDNQLALMAEVRRQLDNGGTPQSIPRSCSPLIILKVKVKVKSLSCVQLFATPPTDYSLPGSSVHGIFQARILEWVAISFSR